MSLTSTALWKTAVPCPPRIASAAAAMALESREQMASLQPSAASASAIALPMPRLAAVTTATRS